MSIIIGILLDIDDHNKEIIFASDGRAIEIKIADNGEPEPRILSEDFEKIKQDLVSVTNAEEIVFEELKKSNIDYEVVVDI